MLQKIVNFFGRFKMIIFLFSIVLVNVMTWFITGENQKNGIYPVDADSTGIPIMWTAVVSIVMLTILFFENWFFKKSLVLRRKIVIRVVIILLYSFALLFGLYGFLYWNYSDHYPISMSYLILSSVLFFCLICDLKTLK